MVTTRSGTHGGSGTATTPKRKGNNKSAEKEPVTESSKKAKAAGRKMSKSKPSSPKNSDGNSTRAPPKRTPKTPERNDSLSPKRIASKSHTTSPNTKRKRKSSPEYEGSSKRLKQSQSPEHEPNTPQKITINRAPVLQLWGASVAHFIYPELTWETCVSIGSAISTICAIAKGRSIGTIGEKDTSEHMEKKREDAKRKKKGLDAVEVMHFKLKLKDGLALVGSEQKGKPSNEDHLKKKFGEDNYRIVCSTFKDALKSWVGNKEELNRRAFGFYENFRPSVSAGQRGWGRKGNLELGKVKNTIEK